jgi:hypothetical protein
MTKRLENITNDKTKVNLNVGIVEPKSVNYKSLPFFSVLSGKIKVHYSCGNCEITQNSKISFRDNYSIIPCEYCGAINRFKTPPVDIR